MAMKEKPPQGTRSPAVTRQGRSRCPKNQTTADRGGKGSSARQSNGCIRPVEQEVLQREWEGLGHEEKAIRRAQRARRGERCSRCGCVGYFRRNCPTCPLVRYDVKTDGWRSRTANETEGRQDRRHDTDLEDANRPEADQPRGVVGGGFLWGTLAQEAMQPVDARNGGKAQGGSLDAGSTTNTLAMSVEMPSLAGSSDLSSGVISGFRRALVWANDGGEASCRAVLSSLNDLPRGSAAQHDHKHTEAQQAHLALVRKHDSLSQLSECDSAAEKRVPEGMGISLGSGTTLINGGSSSGIDGRDEVKHELAWRWPDYCSAMTQGTDSIGSHSKGSRIPNRGCWTAGDGGLPRDRNEGHPSIDSFGGPEGGGNYREDSVGSGIGQQPDQATGYSATPSHTPSRAVVQAPRGSYLRIRNRMVLTIQENLHLALARLGEAAREQVHLVTSRPSAAEILRGPRGGPPPERYYGKQTHQDFRDFFDAEEEEAARKAQPKAYTYLGNLREEGKAKYVFDRTSHPRRGSLAVHLRGDYLPQPGGYRGTNVHAVVEWRRPNTTLDRYAPSGRDAIRRVAQSRKAQRRQTVWVGEQTKARQQRRQRANHLQEVYRSELSDEVQREIEVLRLPPREQRVRVAEAMKDRVAAADRIVRNVKRYGLLGNIEDAHYVRYTIDAARVAGLSPEVQPASRRPSCGKTNVASVAAGALVLEGKSSVTTGDSDSVLGGKSDGEGREASNGLHAQRKRGGEGGGTGKGCAGGLENPNSDYLEMSPYRPSITKPAERAAKLTSNTAKQVHRRGEGKAKRDKHSVPEMEQNAAAKEAHRKHIQSERLRTFKLAGHPIRRGDEEDTTAVPALIPIPRGFGASEAPGEGQKSFVAGRIMEALRASQADSVTGRKAKIAVPLWHRATEEIDSSNTGSILYSDLIGHTYSVLVGPRRIARDTTG